VLSIVRLPSGVEVDVDRPDFSLCVTAEDFVDFKYALQEKIIDIELQIDLHKVGKLTCADGTLRNDPAWLPRANAALKWAKLHRDECQTLQGRVTAARKKQDHDDLERGIIDVIKAVATPQEFQTLLRIASAISRVDLRLHRLDDAVIE
jgi:hypothetical protein